MELMEAIEKRHSYRGPFKESTVPREDLRKIVEAGIRAPSGYNDQTTSFIAVDDAGVIKQIGEILGNERAGAVPAVIVVLMQRTTKRAFFFGIEDYAAATENILLAMTAMGYAGVWIDGSLRRDDRAAKVAELLSVPSDLEVRVVIPLGVPAEQWDQKEKKPFAERAWYNRYGGA